MPIQFRTYRRNLVEIPTIAFIAGALAVTVLLPVPAEAQGFGLRAGAASGQNGAVAGSRGVISNGEGSGAIGRNFVVGDGQGNGMAGSGGCAVLVNLAGCSGRTATWASDGRFSGMASKEITGQNGFVSAQRNLERDADGNWSGARALDAAGENGSYSGNAGFDDGSYSRDATYSGTAGQSATVQGDYAVGSGGSRTVTCIDASGAVVECP